MLKSVKTIILATIILFTLLPGCKGSDTREKVDNTVEELTGKKKIDQMKKMEKDIGKIADQQEERFEEFNKPESEEEE